MLFVHGIVILLYCPVLLSKQLQILSRQRLSSACRYAVVGLSWRPSKFGRTQTAPI